MQLAVALPQAAAVSWLAPETNLHGLRTLCPREHLFHEGDPADSFFEVLEGVVRAYKIFADGRRQIVSFAYAGEVIGFGQGDIYRFDCDALTSARVRVIARSSLLRVVRERPDLGQRLLDIAASEVAQMQNLSILLCRRSALEKLAAFLLDRAEQIDAEQVPLPMSRTDIADFLGLTTETVSRNMTRLRTMKVISLTERGHFAVRDWDRLQSIAEGDEELH